MFIFSSVTAVSAFCSYVMHYFLCFTGIGNILGFSKYSRNLGVFHSCAEPSFYRRPSVTFIPHPFLNFFVFFFFFHSFFLSITSLFSSQFLFVSFVFSYSFLAIFLAFIICSCSFPFLYFPLPPLLWIRDILVRIRIRILLFFSVGFKMPTKSFFSVFLLLTFLRFTSVSKNKES
jgi:hypothetical protein